MFCEPKNCSTLIPPCVRRLKRKIHVQEKENRSCELDKIPKSSEKQMDTEKNKDFRFPQSVVR